MPTSKYTDRHYLVLE